MHPTREQILAASAGWVAVVLNLLTIGSGYLYQRRLKAFWLTLAAAVSLLVADNIAASRNKDQDQPVALIGALLLAPLTAVEAALAVKRVREQC